MFEGDMVWKRMGEVAVFIIAMVGERWVPREKLGAPVWLVSSFGTLLKLLVVLRAMS